MDGSAHVSRSRPFYTSRAEVYDLLVTDPVEPWVTAVAVRLLARGASGGKILDAGCGTGRHAEALVGQGFEVTLADASPELLRLAAKRCPSATAQIVDICQLEPTAAFDAVTCRGVLNDLVIDEEREAACHSLAGQLLPGGVLFLDVREPEGARERATNTPRARRIELPDGGSLSFVSTSRWADDRLLIHEEHEDQGPDGNLRDRDVYDFVMRPWSPGEITDRLTRAGLKQVSISAGVGRTTNDRRFVTAVRSDA